MSSTTIREPGRLSRYFSGRRGRELREAIIAYLMILPSSILIFTFGIFPVGFALYVSVHKWQLVRGEFRGLRNYISSIDNFIYILLFAIAIGCVVGVFVLLRRTRNQAKENDQRPWLLAIPAVFHAASVISLLRWAYLQLPEVLDIANKLRGEERTRELFFSLLGEAFRVEEVFAAWQVFAWFLLAALITGIAAIRLWRNPLNLGYQINFTTAWLAAALGGSLMWVVYTQVQAAYAAALESGADPGIWPQLITVSSGVLLLLLGWKVWKGLEETDSVWQFILRMLGASALLVGAALLIIEIPTIMASGDKNVWLGLKVTVFYSLGTVPIQLAVSLFLSILLFQKLKGSEFFRITFFLPYVTPAVASAAVFKQLFSNRPQAPANFFLQLFGAEPELWLRESDGIFTMLTDALGIEGFPQNLLPAWLPVDLSALLADWLTGPSLALTVIIIYSIWTFVGYNTVIYLAGLGNIPTSLTEAAEIDGASKWEVFRHITFPLLSPTTYFLSLISIIGTFKAFNHIWIMRTGEALGTTDPFSVVIFEEFFNKTRYGYASALAFVLFAIILGLTYVNNKIQGSKVFYG